MIKKFTPEDLKKYWPEKYDNWNCALNGKGEWICGNGKISGKIVTKINALKAAYPDLEIRKVISTGGFGLNIWSTAITSITKSSKSK